MYCDLPVFERCCFCLPLRRGIIVFGYVSIIAYILNIAEYSYVIHHKAPDTNYPYRMGLDVPEELSLVIACTMVIFNAVLIYGAHKKLVYYIKVYYNFMLVMVVASTLLDIVDMVMMEMLQLVIMYMLPLSIAQLFMHLYILLITRSLIKRVETSGPQGFDNQLNQVVSGDYADAHESADRMYDN